MSNDQEVVQQDLIRTLNNGGAPIAQFGEPRTLRKVAGSILTRGTVLCP